MTSLPVLPEVAADVSASVGGFFPQDAVHVASAVQGPNDLDGLGRNAVENDVPLNDDATESLHQVIARAAHLRIPTK